MSVRFIDETAARLLKKHPEGMYKAGVFFSNSRLPMYLLHSLQKQSSSPQLAPCTENFRQFILRHSPLSEGTELRQLLLLHEMYRNIGGTQDYTDFLPTARLILQDFDELDEGLVDPKTFFTSLKSLKSLNTFLEEDREEEDRYSKNYALFWEQFEQLYYRSREVFRAEGCCTAGMIAREQAEDMHWIDHCGLSHFYLVGFTGMLAFEEKIATELIRRGGEYWVDTDRYYLTDSGQEAGYFFRKYKKMFIPELEETASDSILHSTMKIRAIGAPGIMSQCRVAVHELEKIHRERGNLDGVALILADKHFLKPLMQMLPREISPVNISMGFPMTDAHLGSFADLIMRLYEEEKIFGQKDHFYFRNILLLLKHPFFPMLCTDEDAAATLEKDIRTHNTRFIRPDVLQPILREELFSLIQFTPRGEEFLSRWDSVLSVLLERLIQRERDTQETDLLDSPQFIQDFRKNIRGLRTGLPEGSSTEVLLPLLREYIAESRIPFEGNRREGLQLIGLIESRGLDFSHVLILGMNEGNIPAGKTMKTFIPFELRRFHGLTTQREKDSITAYLFYRLLHRSEEMILMYGTEVRDFGGGEMSRFIQQIHLELQDKNPALSFRHERYNVSLQNSSVEPIVIEKTPEVMDRIRNRLTGKGLSPTGLTGYLYCPLQFYLKTIEQFYEERQVQEYIGDDILGNAVHKALEELYKTELGKELDEQTITSWIEDIGRIESYILGEFRGKFRDEEIFQGRNLIIYQVAMQMAMRFLDTERRRIREGEKIQVDEVEMVLSREMEWNGMNIRFSGKSDRVDRVNGVRRISDYKTGTVKSEELAFSEFSDLREGGGKSKAVQLYMYAWMTGIQEPMYSEIIGLKEPQKDFRVTYSKRAHIDSEELRAFEDDFLKPVIEEIMNPDIPFTQTADEKACTWCAFKTLCQR